MSVSTEINDNLMAKSEPEINEMIMEMCKSSTDITLKSSATTKPKAIHGIALLSNMTHSDTTHALGSTLYSEVVAMLRASGEEFFAVASSNYYIY